MKPKTGRPPKQPTGTHTTLTLRIPSKDKQTLIQMADAYDMTLTEYILTLINQDATPTQTNQP